jgi:ubiquinol-cytochrome c reductase cytochrome b subunit
MRSTGVLFRRVVAAVAAVVLLSGVGCVPKRPVGTPLSQNAGAAIFESKGCEQCHEINGRGGQKGPGLTHVGARVTEDKIRKQILEGGHMMPGYKDVLSAQETAALVRYLHKLR